MSKGSDVQGVRCPGGSDVQGGPMSRGGSWRGIVRDRSLHRIRMKPREGGPGGRGVLLIPMVSMGGGGPSRPSCPGLSQHVQLREGGVALSLPCGGTDEIPGVINWGHGPARRDPRRAHLIPDPPRTLSPRPARTRAGPGVPSVRARPAPTPERAELDAPECPITPRRAGESSGPGPAAGWRARGGEIRGAGIREEWAPRRIRAIGSVIGISTGPPGSAMRTRNHQAGTPSCADTVTT